MDQHTRNNWRKIKAALEAAGKTDTAFYRRAVVISQGGSDPDPGVITTKNNC